MGVFGSTNSTTRTQGTVAAPKAFPNKMLVSVGIAALLAAWGAGIWYYTIGRNTIFKPESAAPYVAPNLDAEALPVAPAPAPATTILRAPAAPQLPPAAQPDFAPGTTTPAIAGEPERAKDACAAAIAAAGIKLPADFKVLATGAYRGRDLDFRVGRNGNRASQIDVIVNSPGKPVALMLGAYDPVVWNLSWTSGTKIVAVYVGGYEPQQVVGPGANGPMLISVYEQKERGPCPYFYLGGEGLPTVNPAARRVFGKPVDMVYPVGKDGSVVVGGGVPLGGYASNRAPVSAAEPRNPLQAEEGLDFAIRMGQLRKATAADGALWAKALTQNGLMAHDLPPVAGQSEAGFAPPPDRVYIVLSREFIFPDGLYGAHSVTFVVPPGVPRPRGNPGHSPVYEVR